MPYVGVGAGYIKSHINEQPGLVISPLSERFDQDNPFAHVAGGFMVQMNNAGTQLRGELRYRADLRDPEDYRDLLFNVGLVFPFGSAPEAPILDSDGDGVIDGSDQCPGTPPGSAVDSRGCELDGDGDGIPNSRDACPDTSAGARVDGKGCEVDADSDRDGVNNRLDRCPNTPRGVEVDVYGCRKIGDADGDGVLDNRDRCPNTASGARVDVNGCEFKEAIQLRGVTFETNSATLTSTSLGVLNDAAATLKRNSDLSVEAQGHTDSSGADSYNLALSQRRAEAVRDYLVREGVAADKLTAKGYGETQPVADNSTAAGRAENRRVVLKILNP
ncbi:MAG: OmpA family protein [Pseudomonadota bacterium]